MSRAAWIHHLDALWHKKVADPWIEAGRFSRASLEVKESQEAQRHIQNHQYHEAGQ